jgi:hypothetical protein
MKLRTLLLSVSALTLAGAALYAGSRQDPPPAATKEHALLKQMAGDWDVKVSMFMGPEAMVSNGTYEAHMVGDTWVAGDFEGDFMGMPFYGHGVNGYDVKAKKHVSYWFDSMTTSPNVSEGTYDAAAQALTMKGKGFDMMGKEVAQTETTVFKDADTMLFSMTQPGADGKDVKVMEIVYTRQK